MSNPQGLNWPPAVRAEGAIVRELGSQAYTDLRERLHSMLQGIKESGDHINPRIETLTPGDPFIF